MTQRDQNVLHLYLKTVKNLYCKKLSSLEATTHITGGVQSRNDSCCTYLKTKMFLLSHCHVSYCYGLSAIHDDIAVIVAS